MKRLVKILAPLVLGLIVAIPLVSAQGTPIGEVDAAAGETVYNQTCMACHQQNGQGLPGAFPPLADHVHELVAPEGGRAYVANVVLWGLQGAIDVHGMTYNSFMPSQANLDDQQIADVLNYISTAWENAEKLPEGFVAFTAEEVAAQRETQKTPAEVYTMREALEFGAEE